MLIVAVTSVWADQSVYYPLHVRHYTSAERPPGGNKDSDFRTKPQVAVELVDATLDTGYSFRSVVSDCTYGENPPFAAALWAADLPFVLALKLSTGMSARLDDPDAPEGRRD
jgi:SRSO17 transposase